jgi:pimeloyl-ACP methyl ester carboxylesterase
LKLLYKRQKAMLTGEDDHPAPVNNGYFMPAEHGECLRPEIIPDASLAAGLEKPAAIASAILDFWAEHPTRRKIRID